MRLVFGAPALAAPAKALAPVRLVSCNPGKPSPRRRRPNIGRRCRLRRAQGARRLNWPRVRLLFLGHGSPPPVVATPEGSLSSAAAVAAVAVAAAGVTELTGGSGGTGGCDGEDNNTTKGCWLATLDRELLWLIADSLVTMHIADSSPPITGGDVV